MTTGLNFALPSSWTWLPLKYATTYLNRGTTPDYVDDGPVRAVGQAANQAAGLNWERTRYHNCEGNPNHLKGYLIPDDVIINSTGTGTLGRVGYFVNSPDKLPCVADGHVTVARANQHVVDSRYMYYWLTSRPFYDYIYSALIVGATNQIELNRERLATAPIAIPPPSEQRRIAGFLDAELSPIDQIRTHRDQQRYALGELISSEVDEAIATAQTCGTVRLGYVSTVQSGVTVDSNRQVRGDLVTLPYLRVANVQAGRLDLAEVTTITLPRRAAESSTLKVGDVLMTEGGDLDKLGRGTVWRGELDACLHQNHVFAVRPDRRVLRPDYLALLTRSSNARRYFESTSNKTTNLASTSSSKIRDFRIPLADLDEQQAVVDRVDARLRWIAEFDSHLSRQLALLAERRQALITAAVTGQIDVTTAQGVTA